MDLTTQNPKKSKAVSRMLFISGIVVAVIGVLMLIMGFSFFFAMLKTGKSQGLDFFEVIKIFNDQGNMSQLIEPLIKPIAVYGGISVLLFGASHAIKKLFCPVAPAFVTDGGDDELGFAPFGMGNDEFDLFKAPVEEGKEIVQEDVPAAE